MNYGAIVHSIALATVASSMACSAAPTDSSRSAENVAETAAADSVSSHSLLWENTSTGELGAWLIGSDSTHVLGTRSLDWRASNRMRAIDVRRNSMLWSNTDTGQVQSSDFDWLGRVTQAAPLSWTRDFYSGCLLLWRP